VSRVTNVLAFSSPYSILHIALLEDSYLTTTSIQCLLAGFASFLSQRHTWTQNVTLFLSLVINTFAAVDKAQFPVVSGQLNHSLNLIHVLPVTTWR